MWSLKNKKKERRNELEVNGPEVKDEASTGKVIEGKHCTLAFSLMRYRARLMPTTRLANILYLFTLKLAATPIDRAFVTVPGRAQNYRA